MEDNERIILKSYSKVWKIERLLYSLGKKNLPFPIPIRTVVYFLIFVAIFRVNILPFNMIPLRDNFIYSLGVPAALAFLFSKKLLDGKNPLFWLRSNIIHVIRWFMGLNSLNRYKRIKKDHKAVYTSKIAYRVVKVIDE